MSTHSDPHSRRSYPQHRFPQNWSAFDLADAIPLRLSERVSLGLVEFVPAASANGTFAMPTRPWRLRGYAHSAALSDFRVR